MQFFAIILKPKGNSLNNSQELKIKEKGYLLTNAIQKHFKIIFQLSILWPSFLEKVNKFGSNNNRSVRNPLILESEKLQRK